MAQTREESGTEAGPFVLIVDDYADLAEPLARLLKRMGYRTAMAASGAEAIQDLQHQVPSLIILDLFMPDVSGLQLLRWLRETPQSQKIPVIIYTVAADPELLRQCLESGANEVWLKGSLDFFQIMARIAAYVPPPPAHED